MLGKTAEAIDGSMCKLSFHTTTHDAETRTPLVKELYRHMTTDKGTTSESSYEIWRFSVALAEVNEIHKLQPMDTFQPGSRNDMLLDIMPVGRSSPLSGHG